MNCNWYWMELIGFDNTAADYGAAHFISKLETAPEGISLLFSHIDFVNDFNAATADAPLRPCDCSYAGHPHGEERERQAWTGAQLRGLIRELHRSGIKVIFSIFNFYEYLNDDGEWVQTEFCAAHPELVCYDAERKVYEHSISILKRMRDGSLYQSYFLRKLKEVTDFYGFDGVQVADGISSNRPSLQNGDFSDDTVRQFADWLQSEKMPYDAEKLCVECDSSIRRYQSRRAWIIQQMQYEWICFQNARWKDFYDALYAALPPEQYILFINSFWTRDPFEALYRYGIDYRVAYRPGVYALMVEEVSPSVPTFSDEYVGGFHTSPEYRRYAPYGFYLMLMAIKAYLPEFKQITLLPINDNQEQWNVVHDARNELKRAVYRRNNAVIYRGGRFVPCVDGEFYCEADVPQADLQFLEELNKLRPAEEICGVCGYTLYYPRKHLFEEVRRYIETKEYGFYALAEQLLTAGTQLCAMVAEADAAQMQSPVLVLFPEYLDADELAALGRANTTVVYLSRTMSCGKVLVQGEVTVSTNRSEFELDASVAAELARSFSVKSCELSHFDAHGGIWTAPLKYRRWNGRFLRQLSRVLNGLIGCPEVENPQNRECKLTVYRKPNGNAVVFLSNDEAYTCCPRINMRRPIRQVIALTKHPGYRVTTEGNTFTLQVTQRSMEIVEVVFG